MKSDNPLKHFILAFAIAIAIYLVAYQGIEYRRTRNGPWQVTFTQDSTGSPALVINQPKLSLTNIQLTFPGETLSNQASTNPFAPTTLSFSQPKPVPFDLPIGKCVFIDTTFLPGTLTFQIFGHEIELLPRVMIIDHLEHPWRANETIPIPRRVP